MRMQLKVIKADGTAEEYLHTKIVGTISNAFSEVGRPDIFIAEELAEVVTYHLYHQQSRHSVATSEILSIIKVVLTSTNNEDAAIALSEHYYERKLRRSRIEVVRVDIQELSDAELLNDTENLRSRYRWDKARIVNDLVAEQGLSRQMARTIASMVEEKIFNMGITPVPAGLIKQLVLRDAAAILQAQQQLQTV